MRRTQIYLSHADSTALDRVAARTGRTRSQMIREAVGLLLDRRRRPDDVVRVLRDTSGAWRRRGETGAASVERLRRGRLARLHRRTARA